MLKFQQVKSRRVSDEIEDQIRRMLVAGELKPGDKLPPERELAVQLGVGRNALREALRSLEMAGMVELRKGPKGGSFVSHGTTDILTQGLRDLITLRAVSIKEITEARILLEQSVVHVACTSATDDDLAALENVLKAAQDAYERKDFEAKLRKLIEFHIVLARATHNPILVFVTTSIMDLMLEYTLTIGPDRNDLSLIALWHVFDAVRARDSAVATKAMNDHLERMTERYLEYERQRELADAESGKLAELTYSLPW